MIYLMRSEQAVSIEPAKIGRLPFIDFARGIVMAIMAWDHVSSFWHALHHGGEGILGRAPPFTNLIWFLERFVSHVCAPTFIFLAGTVLALSALKRVSRGESQTSVTIHMVKRGLVRARARIQGTHHPLCVYFCVYSHQLSGFPIDGVSDDDVLSGHNPGLFSIVCSNRGVWLRRWP